MKLIKNCTLTKITHSLRIALPFLSALTHRPQYINSLLLEIPVEVCVDTGIPLPFVGSLISLATRKGYDT